MRILILLFGVLCFKASAQLKPIMWQVTNDSITRWEYYFGDDFNTLSIDKNKWYDGYPWGGLQVAQRIYTAPEMIEPNEGYVSLKINKTNEWRGFPAWMLDTTVARKNNIELKNGQMQLNYLTSCIWSKQSFKYGYFECRCKVPKEKGLWPAFWLFGQNNADEIDFMECKGERTKELHVDVHCPNQCDHIRGFMGSKNDWGGWVKMNQNLTDEWVVFSGVWLPNHLVYYVNGVPVSYFKGDFATPMNVIANLSMAGDKGGFSPGPDESTHFPSEFLVDYIRVWKLESDPDIRKASVEKNPLDENKVLNETGLKETKISRKVGAVYDKKILRKERGFISLIPTGNRHYQIHVNGSILAGAIVRIVDEKGTKVKEQILTQTYTLLNLQALQKGNYTLEIEVNGIKKSEKINL